jgi:hypothetical protein
MGASPKASASARLYIAVRALSFAVVRAVETSLSNAGF